MIENTTTTEVKESDIYRRPLIKLTEKEGYYYKAFLHQILSQQINLQADYEYPIKKASFSKIDISPSLQEFTLSFDDNQWLWGFHLRFVDIGDLNGDNVNDIIIGTHSEGGGVGGGVANDIYFFLLSNGDGIFRQMETLNFPDFTTDLTLPQNIGTFATIDSISNGFLIGKLNYCTFRGEGAADQTWESTPAKYKLSNSLGLKLIEYEK